MALSISNKHIDFSSIATRFVQGERYADVYTIPANRYDESGRDLSTLAWVMQGANADYDVLVQHRVAVSVDADNLQRVSFVWEVHPDYVARSGKLALCLMGVDENGETVVKYNADALPVAQSLSGSAQVPISAIEQALREYAMVAQNTAAAISAAEAAEKSATQASDRATSAATSKTAAAASAATAAQKSTAAAKSETAAATSAALATGVLAAAVKSVNGLTPDPTTGDVRVPAGVGSVCGVRPLASGDVVLTAGNVGAYTQAEADGRFMTDEHATEKFAAKADIPSQHGGGVLDNPELTINQRGVATYSVAGFCVDRWRLSANTTYNVAEKSLTATAYNTDSNFIVQGIDKKDNKFHIGGAVALSAVINGVFVRAVSTVMNRTQYATLDLVPSAFEDDNCRIKIFATESTNLGSLVIIPKKKLVFQWVKLELGSATTPFVAKKESAELQECMRYFQKVVAPYIIEPVGVVGVLSRYQWVFVPQMRIAPTISDVIPYLTYNVPTFASVNPGGALMYGTNWLIKGFSASADL